MGHLKVSAAILTARQSLGYFHGEGGGGAGWGGCGGVVEGCWVYITKQHKTHTWLFQKKRKKKSKTVKLLVSKINYSFILGCYGNQRGPKI